MQHGRSLNGKLFSCLLILFVLGLGAVSRAEAPEKAHSADEEALRVRAGEFYTHLHAGRLARAEAYVHRDAKEVFRYSAGRGSFLAFEIARVAIDDTGSTATVTVNFTVMGTFSPKPVVMPSPSTWRLVDGVWYIEVVRRAPVRPPGGIGAIVERKPEELKFAQERVSMGKLKAGDKTSLQISFTNTAEHTVKIADLQTACDCLLAKTDKPEYKQGEAGELLVEFNSAGYVEHYAQTIRVITDPGQVTNRVTVTAYIERPAPKQESAAQR